MKLFAGILALWALSVGAWAQVTVETYTVSGQASLSLPGTPSGGGLSYSGTATLSAINFAAGSMTFLGNPVDFDGTEAAFLANSYSGNVFFPTTSGPATVTVTGLQAVSGTTTWNPSFSSTNTQLGASFSASHLDILTGVVHTKSMGPSLWSSTAVPVLNGTLVDSTASSNITSVDPINGIVGFSGSGNVRAAVAVPSLPVFGLAFLVLGALLLLARKLPKAQPVPSV